MPLPYDLPIYNLFNKKYTGFIIQAVLLSPYFLNSSLKIGYSLGKW